jgi:hypothetical protein
MADVVSVAAIGMSIIASEHFFSSMLTSPMTTKRFFAGDPEGTADTIKALKLAIIASVASGLLLSYLAKSWIPLVTTLVICAFYWIEYNRALKGVI